MIQRVCLIVNYNLYESKRHFTQKLAEAFEQKQIKTLIIDTKEAPLEGFHAAEIQQFQPDFTCSFNSLAPLKENEYLWDILRIPHISFIIDPALYSVSLTKSPYSILTCVDRSDYSAIRSMGFERIFFWPHAVENDLTFQEKERPYDVVFLGSCYDYESLRKSWQTRLTPGICKVLDDAIELATGDLYLSFSQALVSAWNDAKLPSQSIDFMKLYYYLDYYMRGADRVKMIRSIKDAKVHVFGGLMIDERTFQHGWSHYVGNQSNVEIHPPVSFPQGLELLKKTKISLNSVPSFRDGSHERVFASLACGAVPITTLSMYLQEQFLENKELLFFHPQKINEQIQFLLSNEQERAGIANAGRSKVLKEHTWNRRVEQLLESLQRV